MSAYEVTLRRSGDTFVLGSVATRGRQGDAGGGGGGGGVDSVNGETGVVVLTASDVGADASGSAAAVAATAAAGDIAVAAAASSALSSHAASTGAGAHISSASQSKLDGIEAGATGDQTAAEILAKLVTVDGTGSGLVADLHAATHGAGQPDAITISATQISDVLADGQIPSSIARDAEVTAAVSAALASHEADTTNVHGIADTSALATATDVTTAVSTHAGASDPHGDRAYALGLVDDLSGVSNQATARTNLGLGALATLNTVGSSEITDGAIVNGDINAAAAIAYSKLNLAAGIVNADLAAGAAIAYSKLNLTGSIVAGDLADAELAAIAGLTSAADRLPYFTGAGSAALATFTAFGRTLAALADAAAGRTALGLGSLATESAVTSALITDGTIVNGDINGSAGIALSKLATDPLARANHTGTQTASTISDFASTGNALWAPINSGTRMPGIPRTNIPDSIGSVVSIGAANRAVYQRVDGAGTITKIGFNVGTSSGNVSAATCTGTAGRSVTVSRSGTSGAVACPASGYAEVTLGGSTAVTSNDWMAISCDNNTATFRRNSSGTFGIGTNLCLGFTGYENTAHPVPSTPTIVTDSVPPYTLIGVP